MTMQFLIRPILILGGIFFSISWLVPNRTEPWRGFHSEFASAIGLGLIALGAVLKSKSSLKAGLLVRLLAFLLPVPFFQYCAEILPFSGQAWISMAYIYASLLMLLAGGVCKKENAIQLGDVIFAAVFFAALISMVIQLQQWLGINQDGALDVWVISRSGGRPAGNLGQPNHMATLLLWGLIGAWWWKWRGVFGNFTIGLISSLFAFGIALTQSRTGAIGILFLIAALMIWGPLRSAWGAKKAVQFYAATMSIFFVASFLGAQKITSYLLLIAPADLSDRLTTEARPVIWKMLIQAILDRPLLGYGWNSVVTAQIAKSIDFPSLQVAFFQSHNIFLDIVIWMGLPLGGFVVICFVIWIARAFAKVSSPVEVFFFLMLLVVGIHAMFEYPLHYAYFLLPAMLIAGVLDKSKNSEASGGLKLSASFFLALIAIGACGLLLIARDYLVAESSFESFQLEQAGLRAVGATKSPDLLLLNQLKEEFDSKLFRPRRKMSDAEIFHAEKVLGISPSAKNFMDMALVYGLNGKREDVDLTLVRMCKMVPKEQCERAEKKWNYLHSQYSELKSMPWPKK